jgi:hypothetical protein
LTSKKEILDLLRFDGLDLEVLYDYGLPHGDSLTFERAIEVMSQAHCFSMVKFQKEQSARWPMPLLLF